MPNTPDFIMPTLKANGLIAYSEVVWRIIRAKAVGAQSRAALP